MIEQITGVDAKSNSDDPVELAVGFRGIDGRSEFEIAKLREGEVFIDYVDKDGGVWLQDNRFTTQGDAALEVV